MWMLLQAIHQVEEAEKQHDEDDDDFVPSMTTSQFTFNKLHQVVSFFFFFFFFFCIYLQLIYSILSTMLSAWAIAYDHSIHS